VNQHPDGGGTAVIAAPPDVNEPFISPSETLGPEPQSGEIDKVSMILSVVGLLIVIVMVVVVFLMNV
jgi:hypothetical protein